MRIFRWGAISFLFVAFCGAFSSAEARLSYVSQKTDSGSAFLVISGNFESSDNMQDFFTAVRTSNATVVFFNSNGGNISKAIELGRAIRLLKLITMQMRGDECASACSLAFLGGAQRYAQPGSIGVHKSSFSDTSGMTLEQAVSAVQQMTANVITYMIEMGVDPGLLQLSLQYDSSDIRYLSGSEMAKFHVADGFPTNETVAARSLLPPTSPGTPPAPQAYAPSGSPSVASLGQPAAEPPRYDLPSLAIPTARTGRVQHPKGTVTLKSGPESSTKTIATVPNGAYVTVVADTDKWFQVMVGGKVGYMHHSWVWISQFGAAPFGSTFVQVKSFDNLEETRQYIRNSSLPLTAYLATNGWFAITLSRTFTDDQYAANLAKDLREKKAIPDDSMATYGNAFVRKVCCSQ